MIRIKRMDEPEIFRSETILAERQKIDAFYSRPYPERTQERFRFRSLYNIQEIREALVEQFSRKCAYCETPTDISSGSVDWFRPQCNTIDGSEVQTDHYWWLATQWNNLYYCCSSCNLYKSNLFPVSGDRLKIGDANGEHHILLDPCNDNPEIEFSYNDNGVMVGLTIRARITIDILHLNRAPLVKMRLRSALHAHSLLEKLNSLDYVGNVVGALVNGSQPFSAILRHVVRNWIARSDIPKNVTNIAQKVLMSVEVKESFQRAPTRVGKSDHRKLTNKIHKKTGQYLERIEIKNFRGIKNLTLKFDSSADKGASWHMMLGENATGKSSLLQAIALVLSGETERNRLKLDARNFLRYGSQKGEIRAYLMGENEPIKISFAADSAEFQSSVDKTNLLLLGYGSVRLLPNLNHRYKLRSDIGKIDNLFNPYQPLIDPNRWLYRLKLNRFNDFAAGIKELLVLEPEDRFERDVLADGEISLKHGRHRTALNDLSDGFKSMIGLGADIMSVMSLRWPAMEVAQGIVLIDEIGAHMHPRWKMRIITCLRRVFPNLQFIATTHDPLCLRGLRQNEISIMERKVGGNVGLRKAELPDPSTLRVDQLLTSEYFGLNGTIDPEIEGDFQEYYDLLSYDNLSSAQGKRLEILRDQFKNNDVFGHNRREQIMLEIIDRSIAKSQVTPLTDQMIDELADIWLSLDDERGPVE